MAPIGEAGAAGDVAAGMEDLGAEAPSQGAAGAGKKGSYVPPALRGNRAGGAGEQMGGSKYGERDDLATLRVTNVCFTTLVLFPLGFFSLTAMANLFLFPFDNRSPRWPKKESCAICSSGSVASLVCSWPRIAKPVWQRALRLSASQTAPTPSRRARRWTAGVSSISFSEWNSQRRRRSFYSEACGGVVAILCGSILLQVAVVLVLRLG